MLRRVMSLWLLAVMLSACAQLGLPQANTFNERLAVGYTTVTAVRTSAASLVTAKKISPDDGQNVLAQTDAARAGLDVARSLAKTDLAAADGKLNAVRTVLTALQSYLAAKGN